MAAQDPIRTRVLIISDTHTAPLEVSTDHPFRRPLPSADVAIHSGDMTLEGGLHEYHATLDLLAQLDAPLKLVIAGNHDRSLDLNFVKKHPYLHTEQEFHNARALWTAPDGRARKEGVTFLDEGVHTFVLRNGATLTVYATPYTPEFYDWGFPYEHNEDRYNPPSAALSDSIIIVESPIPSREEKNIDILISHGPPYGHLDGTVSNMKAGCPHLQRALLRSRPLVHCFGHIHEGWGAQEVTWKSDAGAVAQTASSIAEWKQTGWREGIAASEDVVSMSRADEVTLREQSCAYIDATGLRAGRQTAVINASIMDVAYRPLNAPFLIDLLLPRSGAP